MRLIFLVIFACALLASACSGGDNDTATPSPSQGCAEVQAGVFFCATSAPMLPPEAIALSGYYEVQSTEDTALVVGLPLTAPQTSELDIGYYTFSEGGWTGIIGGIRLVENGTILEGTFPEVPENLVVLRWPGGSQ